MIVKCGWTYFNIKDIMYILGGYPMPQNLYIMNLSNVGYPIGECILHSCKFKPPLHYSQGKSLTIDITISYIEDSYIDTPLNIRGIEIYSNNQISLFVDRL